MNPRRLHDLMRQHFPKIDIAAHEWIVVADEAGLRTEALAALLDKMVLGEELVVEVQRFSDALRYLEALHSERPQFREETVCLLMARCYAGSSRDAEARTLFEQVIAKFGTLESKAELAIWMYESGDRVGPRLFMPSSSGSHPAGILWRVT